MIIGIGQDSANIDRIGKLLKGKDGKMGDRFIKRCFTQKETDRAERLRGVNGHIAVYAKRFAAKEAASKALGTGFAHGVFMKDIGVGNNEHGQPTLTFTNGALERLNALTPKGHIAKAYITLTDEPPLANAMVIIEALPETLSDIG